MRSETVPLTTPMPCLQPCIAAKRLSKSATSGPSSFPHWPLRRVFTRRCSSALPKIGQAGNGFVRTGLPPSRASIFISPLQVDAHVDAAVAGRANASQFAKAQMLIEAISARVQCAQAQMRAGRTEAAKSCEIALDHLTAKSAALTALQQINVQV